MTTSSESDSIYLRVKYKTENVGYPLSIIPFVIFNSERIEVSNIVFYLHIVNYLILKYRLHINNIISLD